MDDPISSFCLSQDVERSLGIEFKRLGRDHVLSRPDDLSQQSGSSARSRKEAKGGNIFVFQQGVEIRIFAAVQPCAKCLDLAFIQIANRGDLKVFLPGALQEPVDNVAAKIKPNNGDWNAFHLHETRLGRANGQPIVSEEICSTTETSWIALSADKNDALVTHVQILNEPNAPIRFLKLRGLDRDASYRIDGIETIHRGDFLTEIGLTIPSPHGDFTSTQWHWVKTK